VRGKRGESATASDRRKCVARARVEREFMPEVEEEAQAWRVSLYVIYLRVNQSLVSDKSVSIGYGGHIPPMYI
jgi:hypothetical protein